MVSLDDLFIKYGTDKSSKHHNYSGAYERLLNPLREEKSLMFIMGIGGYHFIDRGGGDLKAFAEYLPNTEIVAIDIYDKSFLNTDRIHTYICGQENEHGINTILSEYGDPNIIIDDASHINPLTIKAFEICFPWLEVRGTYVIEDTHTSYWEEIASDGTDFKGGNHENTVINYFKHLADCLNGDEGRVKLRGIPSETFPIESITFYKKMIMIKKKQYGNIYKV